jgi:3-oxoadipate enol-lactonase
MIDIGTGPPLVLIPGIQGRWEWMRPTVTALAQQHRVLAFSLNEPPLEHGEDIFDAWARHIDLMLDRAGVGAAAIVGISFGGLVGVRYAARRPERVRSLTLVSTPSPRWRLDPRSAGYARHPLLSLPLFAIRAVTRLGPEIIAARPTWLSRLQLGFEYAWRTVSAPMSPATMARWARTWMATDLTADPSKVTAPTLVVTGEPRLDRVVPVSSTLEYLELIPHARHVTLTGTGHIGIVTKATKAASLITVPHAS